MTNLLLQIAADTAKTGDKAGGSSERLIDVLSGIGIVGIVVMIIIFILAVVTIFIFFERYNHIRKAGKIDPHFMNNIKDFVTSGNVQSARDLCLRTDSAIARMMEKGVIRIGKSLKDINSAVENVGNLEILKLERGLSTLATISGTAPMLGFFGTVTGMINVFHELSQSENVQLSDLSGGIFEAMLTTAFGLFVGIIAFVAYNLLVSMVQKVIFKMEASTTEFIDLLQEPTKL